MKEQIDRTWEIITNEVRHIVDNTTLFIGIHIRLGDLVSGDETKEYGFLPPEPDYVRRAVEFYRKRYPYNRIIWVVASDGTIEQLASYLPPRNKRNKPSVFHYVNTATYGNIPAVDMGVLTLCNHTLMTVGTFGWWIGWLTGGDVVYQKRFAALRSQVHRNYANPKDYFPSHWVGL